jgi:hypothetical protein
MAEPIEAVAVSGLLTSLGRAFMVRPDMKVADLYTLLLMAEAEGLERQEYAERAGLSNSMMAMHIRDVTALGLVRQERRVLLTDAGRRLVDRILNRR